MSMEDILSLLQSTGLPVTYRAFPSGQAPSLPYPCYFCTETSNFCADNRVYQIVQGVDVELYTTDKRPDLEEAVEAALSGLIWEKTESYLDDERCYEIIYEIEV